MSTLTHSPTGADKTDIGSTPAPGTSTPIERRRPMAARDGCARNSLIALLGIVASLMSCASLAAKADNLSGKDLMEACEATDVSRRAFCLGYVRGAAEVYAAIPEQAACVPATASTAALVNATMQWLRMRPEMRDNSAHLSIEMAVRWAFPCH
jgi:Ssp1 endopeptidase immunity protein Rap1a